MDKDLEFIRNIVVNDLKFSGFLDENNYDNFPEDKDLLDDWFETVDEESAKNMVIYLDENYDIEEWNYIITNKF